MGVSVRRPMLLGSRAVLGFALHAFSGKNLGAHVEAGCHSMVAVCDVRICDARQGGSRGGMG